MRKNTKRLVSSTLLITYLLILISAPEAAAAAPVLLGLLAAGNRSARPNANQRNLLSVDEPFMRASIENTSGNNVTFVASTTPKSEDLQCSPEPCKDRLAPGETQELIFTGRDQHTLFASGNAAWMRQDFDVVDRDGQYLTHFGTDTTQENICVDNKAITIQKNDANSNDIEIRYNRNHTRNTDKQCVSLQQPPTDLTFLWIILGVIGSAFGSACCCALLTSIGRGFQLSAKTNNADDSIELQQGLIRTSSSVTDQPTAFAQANDDATGETAVPIDDDVSSDTHSLER